MKTARVVALTVALSLLWPLLQVAAYGSFDALLGVGPQGPARAQVQQDIPDLHLTDDYGHDGQQFYVIARHPFDPKAAEGSVDPLAYRYRRILFPLVGSILAPHGGRLLIAVFLLESLVGVALGAWALSRLPGGPRWLPLTMAFTPGVIAAMGLSLSDALAAGLGLVAVALATERRWWPAIAALVAAVLTRETLLIVAAGLTLTPGMPRRMRAATLAVPTAAFLAWSAWSSHAAAASSAKGGADQLAFPFAGWLSPHVPMGQRALLLAALALLVAGAWRAWRTAAPHLAAILGLGSVLLVSISDLVAFNWVNSMRPIAPMVPLALYALTRDVAPAQETEVVPTTAAVGIAP
ncbi:MAG: hypothetical protein U0P45_10290 [Acidimicrobiales bacterium]